MTATIRPVKGTRDYYPEDMALRAWLYDQMRHVSELFGYQEYQAPILEPIGLYAAKSGDELVEKQSYVFEDRGGDRITLRPELTPSLARMVAQRQNQLAFPLRWWSFGPFWRYERPQKGRTREFFQWNIDLIGDPSPEAEAEIVAIAAAFFKQVGLRSDEVQIRVNDRRLLAKELESIGIPEQARTPLLGLIDRKDKLSPEAWILQTKDIGLANAQIDSLNELLANKELWRGSESLERFFQAIEAFGASEYVVFEPSIIRGLQYYTGTVFEAWDTAGEFRALFGGGRYDNLVSDVGGKPVEAVGFAVGDLVITLLLQSLGRLPELAKSPTDVFVTLFDVSLRDKSFAIMNALREAGIRVAGQLTSEKLGKQFKYADRIGAKLAVILGPDEAAKGKVGFKVLATGEQGECTESEMIAKVRQLLEA
ncbi:MAG: histidine--tRNA ligase [Chloroflexi bacterium]|nr:histidine--tRNA ligase [Chloroflexota bacterium]